MSTSEEFGFSPNEHSFSSDATPLQDKPPPRTIYIAGAGIAGMTLALALAKHDFHIVLLEKANSPTTQGAGLQISPNARHALDELGLSKAMDKFGFVTRAIDIYPHLKKKPLVSLEMGETIANEFGKPYCVIHRADLFSLLFDACKAHTNIQFFFGVKTFDVVAHAKGVSLTFELASKEVQNTRAHAFIGADGVHSPTRRKILNGPDAVYSGFVAWRTLMPTSMMGGQLNLEHTSLLWGPGHHVIAYPHPDRHVINIALFAKEKMSPDTRVQQVNTPSLATSNIKCPRLKAICVAAEGAWQKWPLYAARTSQWHKGPIGIIGDAAHAMLPYQAQGAAMAIEDALILAHLLATQENATSALSIYQKLRKKRVEKIVNISARNGSIYHMEWPFSLARDMVVAAQGPKGHLKRLAWIYNYNPNKAVSKYNISP